MCDLTPVKLWLAAVLAAILVTIAELFLEMRVGDLPLIQMHR
jgi:hypothetical protein